MLVWRYTRRAVGVDEKVEEGCESTGWLKARLECGSCPGHRQGQFAGLRLARAT